VLPKPHGRIYWSAVIRKGVVMKLLMENAVNCHSAGEVLRVNQAPISSWGIPPMPNLRDEPKKFFRISEKIWKNPRLCPFSQRMNPSKSFRINRGLGSSSRLAG